MVEHAPTDQGLPDFSGKVVVFYLAHAPRGVEHGVVMEYAEFRRLDGVLFVLGRGPAFSEPEWNVSSGVAWSAVINYLVFNSREEFMRRMAQNGSSWRRAFDWLLGNSRSGSSPS